MTPEEGQAARRGIATLVGGVVAGAPRALGGRMGCCGSGCRCCLACFPGGREAMKEMRGDLAAMDEEMGGVGVERMVAQVLLPSSDAERGTERE